ncbi:MBL fold metallo-hydrolase [Myxococcota bacterium]|nr:MBL fold metallo-hydrolase [Myxococcota bacterium]MBU1420853.1 MBL fold metallo-hydrolase [Pseudomonadota bacterium]
MDSKEKEPIDLDRRTFMKISAATAVGFASIGLVASIGTVSAAVENGEIMLNELDKPRTFAGRPQGVPPGMPEQLFDDTALIPTKVFDNLYCVGSRSVVAWVLTTSEGIIIIDSMWDNRDGKLIIDGIKQLGLKPADIKKIILTHGHGDHYGGAQYIKDKTNAEILLGKTDIGFMKAVSVGANGPRSPKPSVVSPMSNGDKITLGDTSVTVIDTPGHTPGCMSLIFPVKQNGKSYTAAQWGGTGAPMELKDKLTYRKSIDYFEKQTQAAQATVKINAHLFVDGGYAKLDAARTLKPGIANPWVIGEEGFAADYDGLRKMIDGAIEKQQG